MHIATSRSRSARLRVPRLIIERAMYDSREFSLPEVELLLGAAVLSLEEMLALPEFAQITLISRAKFTPLHRFRHTAQRKPLQSGGPSQSYDPTFGA